MKKTTLTSTVAILACLGLSATSVFAEQPAPKSFGKGNPFTVDELPNGGLKAKLKELKPQARGEAMKRLHDISFPESDAAKYLKVDDGGGVFIVCPIEGCGDDCKDHDHGHGDNESAPENSAVSATEITSDSAANIPIGDGSNETFNPTSTVPISTPPVFNSKPGAPFHIYLDFNGAYVTGKQWTYSDGTTTWSTWDCDAWGTDADKTTFSISEQNDIRRMWERIAEDYAPFNVNVTTDVTYDPDNYTGDKNKVGWLLTTPTTDKNGVRCPHYGYGGVAYVNVFGRSDFFSRYQPAWVTPMGTANTAEAASHEMGHNLGLTHDGLTTGAAYYGGHVATTTAPSWGPIMGTGYNRNVSQWSKGEYLNGNQLQDDLAIIAGKVTYRADDHGSTFQAATAWVQSPVNQNGVIETTGSQDVFTFTTGAGNVSFNASTYRCDTQTWGANLDVVLELYNSSQTLVASSNPLADTNASISASVPAGTYHVVVKPTAAGSPLTSPPNGYTLYGSLGYYTISGTYSAVDSIVLTAPNGGESWLSGASNEITWASGVGGNVKIELLKGGALVSTISSSTPNDGSFSWAIPAAQASASDYRIRLTSLTNPSITAESVSNFSIVPDLLAAALDTTGYTWATSGNAAWFSQSAVTYDGADAAQSGVITHNQSSSVETTLVGPGTMTFWWKVSSESGYDFLRFYINNVEQTGDLARIAGNVDWVQKTVSIPAGSQTVKWSYTKDGSVEAGSDAGWVDQVVFTPASSDGSLAVTPAGGLSASGTYGGAFSPSSLQYTLSNPGGTAINWTAAKTQAWVGLSATGGTLAAGASTSVTVSLNANSLNVGSYNDTVTFTNSTNGTGNTTRSVNLTVSKASQTISFTALDPVFDNDAPFALTATASSGLAVSYTSSNSSVATVSGNTLTVVGPGNTTITASQSGNTNYNAATSVPQTLTVLASNTAPVANPQSVSAEEDTALPITLSASDGDGDALTYAIVSQPANGTLSGTAPSLTYTPNTDFNGADSFAFRVNDGTVNSASATVSITVTPVNDAPTFINDPIILADASEGAAYTGQALAAQATDPDAGDTLTFSKVSGPEWLNVASDGALSGTPPTASAGLNSFIVRVSDSASATAEATLQITVTGLPLPWVSTDIGTGMLAGSATFSSGTFTQAGAGTIGAKSDRLRYTYQILTGDGEIIARISALQNTGNSSRVGVMIRDSLATNSKEIFMGMSDSGTYRWLRRTATNGNTSTSSSSTGTVPNTWVRLVRSGNTITAYKSTNGTSWTTVGSTTNTSFASTCYIGIAVASGSTNTLNTSQFSSVTVTP